MLYFFSIADDYSIHIVKIDTWPCLITGMSGYQPSPGDSDDDEFESVSQVTGPVSRIHLMYWLIFFPSILVY